MFRTIPNSLNAFIAQGGGQGTDYNIEWLAGY